MAEDLEDTLRSALRPVQPPDGFADRVLAHIAAAPAPRSGGRVPRLAAAIAASVLLSAIAVHQWQMNRRQQEQGAEARRQLIEALRVTGEKLDIAYAVVNGQNS
jgi:hypothetical protein